MNKKYFVRVAKELNIRTDQVGNTAQLLSEGATIPFISRYRKEYTDSLNEFEIARIRDRLDQLKAIDKRRESILHSIEKQGKLTVELKQQIADADSLTELEDIYLPYKPKKKTRATTARAKGLEPLAKIIMSQHIDQIRLKAKEFLNKDKGVIEVEEALSGARDIIAEWINEHKYARSRIRDLFKRKASIRSHIIRGKEQEGIKYKSYFEWEENLLKAPSHRILAMFRGENEKYLSLDITPPKSEAIAILEKIFIKSDNDSSEQVRIAIQDGYKRLIQPSMETEMKSLAKEKADEKAFEVFAENLRQLLLAPPLGQKNILAIDPGFRTGCKIVCLDRQSKLLHNETIFPHPPQNEVKQAIRKIKSLVDAYKIEAIAIGNGTGGRQTEKFIKSIRFTKDIIAVMVNESGASVYSASKVAREEFPDYDVTVRGAVSIGRRLMDPLAELVKIDPKSIGVGQYQHDVDQRLLAKSLEDTVISCVNTVGVEVNTSSKQLLSYVSGVGPALAQNIVEYRNTNGPIKSRNELKKVPRFGSKAFQQAAGFLRIQDAKNPLDQSAVHPESYAVVEKMAKKVNAIIEELIKDVKLRQKINLQEFVTDQFGMPTLTDIIKELEKPGRDPRKKFDFFEFAKGVNTIEDLKSGMVLPGIVTNVTAFGAFVDIGVHQDGLVHISQLANKFVKDPNDIVKLNQKIEVKILGVDIERKRIELSMKDLTNG
jgi:uncharacterized protein